MYVRVNDGRRQVGCFGLSRDSLLGSLPSRPLLSQVASHKSKERYPVTHSLMVTARMSSFKIGDVIAVRMKETGDVFDTQAVVEGFRCFGMGRIDLQVEWCTTGTKGIVEQKDAMVIPSRDMCHGTNPERNGRNVIDRFGFSDDTTTGKRKKTRARKATKCKHCGKVVKGRKSNSQRKTKSSIKKAKTKKLNNAGANMNEIVTELQEKVEAMRSEIASLQEKRDERDLVDATRLTGLRFHIVVTST